MTTPVAVIGLGNPMRGDDGVGVAVAAALESTPPPGSEVCTLDGEPARLVDAWRDRDLAILIDAVVTGAEPGTIHELVVGRDPLPAWSQHAGTHSAGLAEAVDLGRALGRLPRELVVIGVEPADVTLGTGLSPSVQARVPELVDRVRRRVGP